MTQRTARFQPEEKAYAFATIPAPYCLFFAMLTRKGRFSFLFCFYLPLHADTMRSAVLHS